MRVLFLSSVFPRPYNPNRGIYCYHLCRTMLDMGHEVRVVSPKSWLERLPAKPPAPLPRLGDMRAEYPTYYYPPGLMRSSYAWFMGACSRATARKAIRELKPDFILSYWAHPDGAVAAQAAKVAGVPVGIIVGGSDVLILAKEGGSRGEAVIRALRSADAIFTVSQHLHSAVLGHGVSPDRVHVVYQGVDPSLFCPGDRAEARQKLGLSQDQKMLLFVGNLVPVKGLEVLLEACQRLAHRGVDFRLNLVGEGPSRTFAQGQAVEFGIQERVRFVGPIPQSELADWYRAADLTVLSSHSEGIPNVLRESVACGTPFVATDVGGVREITDEAANTLVPPGNPQKLADAIAAALKKNRSGATVNNISGTWAASANAILKIMEMESSQRAPRRAMVSRDEHLLLKDTR